MDESAIKALCPVLLVGYGYMGKEYLRILLEMGFNPNEIYVVERDQDKRIKGSIENPLVRFHAELSTVPTPKTVLNVTNSPEHANVIRHMLAQGVLNHFVEKPFVLPRDLPELPVFPKTAKVGVGYLINFSGAMKKLFELMRENNLVILEGTAIWGKDRTSDTRPTSGDLEDEATHPLTTMINAIEFNQQVYRMTVCAKLSSLPFVNMSAQRLAQSSDCSYPKYPNSASNIALSVKTDNVPKIVLNIHSSFTAFDQERRIDFVLGPNGGRGEISHMARLVFDSKEADKIAFRKIGAEENVYSWHFYQASKKLSDQLEAFLIYASGGAKDPRLCDLKQAIRLVEIGNIAVASSNDGICIEL